MLKFPTNYVLETSWTGAGQSNVQKAVTIDSIDAIRLIYLFSASDLKYL